MPTPTFDVEFTKDGDVFQPAQADALVNALDPITDLLLLAHGWNNDKADATALYVELLGNIDKLLALRDKPPAEVPPPLKPLVDALRGRTFGALRVFWPSKKFTDSELIPGGGAATAQAEGENITAVNTVLDALKKDPKLLGGNEVDADRDAAMEKAKALVPQLATVKAQREFVKLLRSVLDPAHKEDDDASEGFFKAAAETLFANAEKPVVAPAGAGAGGGASMGDGGAASLGDLLSGVQAAARRIANFATYYQMKSRAGTVGSKGVAQLLARVRAKKPAIRIHLAGHSFGGRLVTAAAHAFPANTPGVTMSLLQAAFSHNGLSGNYDGKGKQGFFRALIDQKRISGPIIITHTKNDKAVGIAYPLASRIAGQNAAALGDQNDPYGGMGRNGAQKMTDTEAVEIAALGLPGTKYTFTPNRVHNITADVIQDHGDVRRMEVAYAVLSAAAAI